MFDVLIRNGRVVDGTGNPWFPADIGIRDGTIAAIGRIPDDAPGETVIDAAGKIVAPGFIDIHSHSDFVVADGSHGEVLAPFAAQGITTLVTGNCGYSPAPVNPRTRAELASYTTFLRAGDAARRLDRLWRLPRLPGRAIGLMFNVVPMVAHGALRIHEVGFEGRELTPDERTRMRDQLRKAMEEGAWGLSSGLLYAPGIFAPPEEIEDLASELSPFDGLYASHIRGSSETLLPATKEVIRVGEVNGISTQHSHMEAFGRPNWSKLDAIIELHEAARERGVDTGFDVIPYIAANTTLLAIFPPWALAGGVDGLLGRLRDPDARARIRRSIEEDVPGWPCWTPGGWPHNLVEATGWQNVSIMWVESEANKPLEGRSLTDIAEERDRPSVRRRRRPRARGERSRHGPLLRCVRRTGRGGRPREAARPPARGGRERRDPDGPRQAPPGGLRHIPARPRTFRPRPRRCSASRRPSASRRRCPPSGSGSGGAARCARATSPTSSSSTPRPSVTGRPIASRPPRRSASNTSWSTARPSSATAWSTRRPGPDVWCDEEAPMRDP